MGNYATVEDYLTAQPDDARAVLVGLRDLVHDVLGECEDTISYDIPTFAIAGRSIVHVAGWAQHVSLYPVPASDAEDPTLTDDVASYVAGKGTLKFPLDRPVPEALVRRVVAALGRRAAR